MSSPTVAPQRWTQHALEVQLLTPAFLGGADQSAQWRTPPFKALLRQWWRIVKWPQVRGSIEDLREAEAELFGAVQGKASQSKIRMRLTPGGQTSSVGKGPDITHPEVKQLVGAYLYLGYGPVPGRTALMPTPAKAQWTIAFEEADPAIVGALQLISWFGTIGSRSRNAWGSLQLSGADLQAFDESKVAPKLAGLRVLRPLSDCLRENWPSAIAEDDGGPRIWLSAAHFDNWQSAMKALAEEKIPLRTRFKFERPAGLEKRHLFALPVTKHPVNGESNLRWASQLRFKVIRSAGQLKLLCFHVPAWLDPSRIGLQAAGALGQAAPQGQFWREVSNALDTSGQPPRWVRLHKAGAR